MESTPLGGSFRDPSGFMFTLDGTLYRQVNPCYQDHYRQLMDSGLYEALVTKGLLVPHEEADLSRFSGHDAVYRILEPEPISWISYPYEWCFSQLKDAALVTLAAAKLAITHGMILKDATAFNVQFHHGKPLLIDTLSFEVRQPGQNWIAYAQFCQHFLAPLALMAHVDLGLNRIFRSFLDGIPLPLASKLLPLSTHFRFGLLVHLHLHAKAQRKHVQTVDSADSAVKIAKVGEAYLPWLLESLEKAVKAITLPGLKTTWSDYYSELSYSDAAQAAKLDLVAALIKKVQPQSVWDLGANTGRFSRLASDQGQATVAFDIDPMCVEKNYQIVRAKGETHLLPLVTDLTNPSPGLGWAHEERFSLEARGKTDLVMALALVHHLALSNNLPMNKIANFFRRLSPWLIIEFVPKGDPMVNHLLRSRVDIFPNYTREGFEQAFQEHFQIVLQHTLPQSTRVLYLMRAL